jgi:dUTP pyrophosphatase
MPEVLITPLVHFAGLQLPDYKSAGAAGLDIQAAVDQPVTILAAGRALIPSGLTIAIPLGYEVQIRPRSGLALSAGVTVLNSPGTIDSDYRGEICILLVNLGAQPYVVARGARIAQLVLAAVERIAWKQVENLDATVRGSGGFGFTGSGIP